MYHGPAITKFRVLPNTWFDEGTIATLLDDYTNSEPICGKHNRICGLGLFEGYKDGKLDEEVCSFCEFEPVNTLNGFFGSNVEKVDVKHLQKAEELQRNQVEVDCEHDFKLESVYGYPVEYVCTKCGHYTKRK